MKLYFDLLISIGIVTTLLPAIILLYNSTKRKRSLEYKYKKTSRLFSVILLLGTVTLIYGSFLEPNLLITNHQIIEMDGLNDPITIALISDLHIGTYNKNDKVARVVNRIISLNPDMVFIAGDTVDNVTMDEDETVYLYPLKKLIESKIPTYAVHGNHEYGIGRGKSLENPKYRVGNVSTRVKEAMTDMGILYLTNDLVTTTIRGQSIAIFGGDSYWSGDLSVDKLKKTEIDLPTIALVHNPTASWLLARTDVDLILAGHTHGGQIRLPFIGPIGRVDDILPSDWYQGLNEVDEDTQLFVTSGAGETGTRARLFNPPEVVLITIK